VIAPPATGRNTTDVWDASPTVPLIGWYSNGEHVTEYDGFVVDTVVLTGLIRRVAPDADPTNANRVASTFAEAKSW